MKILRAECPLQKHQAVSPGIYSANTCYPGDTRHAFPPLLLYFSPESTPLALPDFSSRLSVSSKQWKLLEPGAPLVLFLSSWGTASGTGCHRDARKPGAERRSEDEPLGVSHAPSTVTSHPPTTCRPRFLAPLQPRAVPGCWPGSHEARGGVPTENHSRGSYTKCPHHSQVVLLLAHPKVPPVFHPTTGPSPASPGPQDHPPSGCLRLMLPPEAPLPACWSGPHLGEAPRPQGVRPSGPWWSQPSGLRASVPRPLRGLPGAGGSHRLGPQEWPVCRAPSLTKRHGGARGASSRRPSPPAVALAQWTSNFPARTHHPLSGPRPSVSPSGSAP